VERSSNSQESDLVSGRYRVEGALGRGGMGAVFRAHDLSTGREIALKRLTAATSRKHVALFEREYHVLAGLRHPCIVTVYDYGTDARGPYYTMELLQGSDISALAPLPWREVCRVLREVAAALTLLHSRRLIHRDLNPRNLWRTPDGHIKLIDFGALAVHGPADHVVGMPALIPPEALLGQPLDQRSDLYALGAVGYWLLTGLQAYPVHAIAQLKEAWKQPVRPPSAWVRNLGREDLEPPPAALDELILSLLSPTPLARAAQAAEVIDRLGAVAGLDAAEAEPVVEAHLRSAVFVGRGAELGRLRAAADAACKQHGATYVVSGAPGLGRSRLLTELGLHAGLRGATVLQASSTLERGPTALAQAFACRLLEELPVLARRTAAPHAALLGHLSPRLRELLGVEATELAPIPRAPGEFRMRVQDALSAWFLQTCAAQPLVMLVDDPPLSEDGSLAWLARLALAADATGLFLVVSLPADADLHASAALKALRRRAKLVELVPLSEEETLEVLRSVFGDALHLARLSSRLHRLSAGNPAQVLQLAHHLVREGHITCRDATWTLPQEVEVAHLPETPEAAWSVRLGALSERSRNVARVLSLDSGTLALERCTALVGQGAGDLFPALEALCREGILIAMSAGYRFADDKLRARLSAELSDEARALAHTRLAEMILQGDDVTPLERLAAAVHGMQGESDARAAPCGRFGAMATEASLALVLRQDELQAAVPLLEAALAIFRGAARPPRELIALLTPLVLAGYYADRKLVERYADETIALQEQALALPLARRLRRVLGAHLSLYVALAWAAWGFWRMADNPRIPRFQHMVMLLFNTVAVSAGVSALCLAPRRAMGFAQVLAPLAALGNNHAAALTYRLSVNMARTVTDQLALTREDWQKLIARLESPRPVRALPEELRSQLHAAALYAYGIIECYRDGHGALRIAERLEGFRLRLYDMSADQLRTIYYAQQGDLERSEHYRQRVEMHAIARGTVWQVEAWLPGPMITLHLRTQDAIGMKQQVQLLERLVEGLPWLSTYLTRARGGYLLLRGRPEDALPHLEAGLREEPQELIGWARGCGALARAYNELGQHGRAKATSEEALSRFVPGDLEFCATNLNVAIEHARALSGLGQHAEAAGRLDALIAEHAPQEGPITLGALHEARAYVASVAGDEAAVQHHVQAMERWYRATNVSSLLRRCDKVRSQLHGSCAEREESAGEDTGFLSILHRIRLGGGVHGEAAFPWLLSQLAEVAEIGEGHLFVLEEAGFAWRAGRGDAQPSPEFIAAVQTCVADQLEGDSTAMVDLGDGELLASAGVEVGGTHYGVFPLHASRAADARLVGCLVCAAVRGESLPTRLLEAAGERLDQLLCGLPTSGALGRSLSPSKAG
jgi:hypothetical protein